MTALPDTSEAPPVFSDADFVIENVNFAELLSALPADTPSNQVDHDSNLLSPLVQSTNNAEQTSIGPTTPTPIPKIGARFNRDVVRTLKNWLAIHKHRPYPTEDDIVMLINHTGLNKTQISNWFTNARRREFMKKARPASPQINPGPTKPIEIVARPGTPAPKRDASLMNPLERWVESPPEHEPADVGDIIHAMASSSTTSMPDDGSCAHRHLNNNSWPSPYNASSESSVGTSHSSDFPSYSSSGSQSSLKKLHRPRQRLKRKLRRGGKGAMTVEMQPFQCTFCTDTFKTKYDWQRHEKSLHLPLEQWVCSLHGPRAARPDCTESCCVFCGEVAPEDAHIQSHDHSSCEERSLEERTFHRKDHLVQHLRLVHNCGFVDWAMKEWKIPVPNVQSRCGFCGITIRTWGDRTDHIGEHFKMGKTMADWHGDWGFDRTILEMVENAIPPYLNHFERSTPFPTKASYYALTPLGSPANAYELLKLEIVSFMHNRLNTTGKMPSDDDIQLESCRVIFATETSCPQDVFLRRGLDDSSWLRDLITSRTEIAERARFAPIRIRGEFRLPLLKVRGKETLFEQCPLEKQLRSFVELREATENPVPDIQIQEKACEIINYMEQESTTPHEVFASWVVKLVYASTHWVEKFRKRVRMHQHNNPSLEQDLDLSLHQNFGWSSSTPVSSTQSNAGNPSSATVEPPLLDFPITTLPVTTPNSSWVSYELPVHAGSFMPGDTVFNRYFVGDLARWVAATMSPNNPVSHVPTDEEIQHQARWIMYGDDDPWNQTPADVAEWLGRFKKDVGMLKDLNTSYLIGDFILL